MCTEQWMLLATMLAAVGACVGGFAAAVSFWFTRKQARFARAFQLGQGFRAERMREVRCKTARVVINTGVRMEEADAEASKPERIAGEKMRFRFDMKAAGAPEILQYLEDVGLAVREGLADPRITWEVLGSMVAEYWNVFGPAILLSREKDPVANVHFQYVAGVFAERDASVGRKIYVAAKRFLQSEALVWGVEPVS